MSRNFFCYILFFYSFILCNSSGQTNSKTIHNNVEALKNLLVQLAERSDNEYFKEHCNSIIKVIESKPFLTERELSFVDEIYQGFTNTIYSWNAGSLNSYTERKMPFIFSWSSPSDGRVSTGWILLPKNWDPQKAYPLYVRLHGLWSPYENIFEYTSMNLKPGTSMNTSFEDGYSFFPWGRGNQWYMGHAETDIWEGISAVESFYKIDPKKRYLTGFSMGGYGAWYLGQKKPEMWAAVGVYAGALWFPEGDYLNESVARNLRDIPVYIVCGTQDPLLSYNQRAYFLLQNAGNHNVSYNTFSGGHESVFEVWEGMYNWIKQFSNDDLSPVRNYKKALTNFYSSPNPFDDETTIHYNIEKDNLIDISIYNIIGQKLRSLSASGIEEGLHEVKWNGCDDSGNPVTEGIYICKLQTDSSSSILKLYFKRR